MLYLLTLVSKLFLLARPQTLPRARARVSFRSAKSMEGEKSEKLEEKQNLAVFLLMFIL